MSAAVGAHVAWHLDFRSGPAEDAPRTKTFGSSDYVASIDANLPSGLDGGSYTFVIEGMTNEDYKALYGTMASGVLVARLHLFWRDAGGVTGYFVDLAGLSDTIAGDDPPKDSLVAVLRVTSLARRPGTRRYEVAIEAREWVYDRALGRLAKEGSATDLLDAAKRIAGDKNIGVTLVTRGAMPPKKNPDSTEYDRSWARRQVALERLRELDRSMENATDKRGLGMYLIRDGVLYAGPGRLSVGKRHDQLTDSTGLVEIISRGQEVSDPSFIPENERDTEVRRHLYDLTLRGRPDIKPGDFVEVVRPAEETDASGTPNRFSLDLLDELKPGTPILLYVRGVHHSLSRERPFVTVLRGVSVPNFDDVNTAWFGSPESPDATTPAATVHDDGPEGRLVGALRDAAERASGKRIDVAQVRAGNVADSTRLPPQTEKLWRGLVSSDGRKYGATALPFDTDSKSSFDDAPYVSPFAWGKFGLVLPRYPGMRVVVAHRQGDPDDILDVGAAWERGTAPASQAGDYWLGLPAAIAPNDRAKVADDQQAKAPSGKATNDLIDADGNRVIEIGKLTVRVGTNLLQEGGQRPTAASEHVHIEHQSGAQILIDQDGNITIKAAGKLDLVAGDQITLDTPANVVVKTGGFMDVKART